MSKRTRLLAWVWLAVAVVGLAIAIWVYALARGMSGHSGAQIIERGALLAVLWLLLTAMGSAGLLGRRRFGWWLMCIGCCTSVLLWALALLISAPGVIREVARHDYYAARDMASLSGCLLMLALSAVSVVAILRDPPGRWAEERGAAPTGPGGKLT